MWIQLQREVTNYHHLLHSRERKKGSYGVKIMDVVCKLLCALVPMPMLIFFLLCQYSDNEFQNKPVTDITFDWA